MFDFKQRHPNARRGVASCVLVGSATLMIAMAGNASAAGKSVEYVSFDATPSCSSGQGAVSYSGSYLATEKSGDFDVTLNQNGDQIGADQYKPVSVGGGSFSGSFSGVTNGTYTVFVVQDTAGSRRANVTIDCDTSSQPPSSEPPSSNPPSSEPPSSNPPTVTPPVSTTPVPPTETSPAPSTTVPKPSSTAPSKTSTTPSPSLSTGPPTSEVYTPPVKTSPVNSSTPMYAEAGDSPVSSNSEFPTGKVALGLLMLVAIFGYAHYRINRKTGAHQQR